MIFFSLKWNILGSIGELIVEYTKPLMVRIEFSCFIVLRFHVFIFKTKSIILNNTKWLGFKQKSSNFTSLSKDKVIMRFW